jgi:hypothetical protein
MTWGKGRKIRESVQSNPKQLSSFQPTTNFFDGTEAPPQHEIVLE